MFKIPYLLFDSFSSRYRVFFLIRRDLLDISEKDEIDEVDTSNKFNVDI